MTVIFSVSQFCQMYGRSMYFSYYYEKTNQSRFSNKFLATTKFGTDA